ncbi:hypothetical protein ACFX2A_035750 [Malus domestica]
MRVFDSLDKPVGESSPGIFIDRDVPRRLNLCPGSSATLSKFCWVIGYAGGAEKTHCQLQHPGPFVA